MSIALYMDENVPRPITVGLRLRAVDVLTVQEDDRDGISDSDVLARAGDLQRIIFTRDDDFLILANQYQQTGMPFVGIIYAAQAIVSIGKCVQDLELIAKASALEDFVNYVQYLPL